MAPLLPEDPLRFGDFWLAGRLGAGGQGVVYEAYDPQGVRVAVKVLHGDVGGSPALRTRLAKEAAAARRVTAFCTARVLAVELDVAQPYIVSEYVEGPSLREAVAAGRLFTGDGLHRLAIGTATALAAIHDAGVVHRDLKPDNVLLGPDGPRVIDFGVARTAEMSLTATGLVTGTPTYMAPEVFVGQRAGAAADVFSWGAVMLFAATGEDPFRAETLGAVMHRVLSATPDLTALPGSLRPLVAAALAKEPSARPAARDLLHGLIGGGQAGLLSAGSAEARRLGGPAGADSALGTLAEDAYGLLDAVARDHVPDVFLRLVTLTEAGELTLRAASREELAESRSSAEQEALERILEVFAYLLGRDGDTITLARPALVQAWPRLRSWIGDERDGLPTHDMIHTAARHWDAHGRREGDVFHGSRLESGVRWAAVGRRHLTLSKLERDFLDACNGATRRRLRRRRLLTAALAGLLVVAVAGGGMAVRQSRIADEQSRVVARQRDEALAAKLATQADGMRVSDPVRAMQASVAAWRLAPTAARTSLQNAWAQRERAAFADPDSGGEAVRQISADGRTFVSVSARGVRIYDLRTGRRIGGWDDLRLNGAELRDAGLSPGGRYLAVAAGRALTVWDTATGRPTGARQEIGYVGEFNGMEFQTGDRYIRVVRGQGGDLWDTRTGRTITLGSAFGDSSVTAANDLVAASEFATGRFGLLSLPGGRPVAGAWPKRCGSVALSGDGRTLACGTGTIKFVDVRTGRELAESEGWDSNGGRIWFSPDGRFVVAGGVGGLKLIRVSDGYTLLTYGATVQDLGFDGTTLRYLSDDTVVSLDLADLLHPVRLPGRAPETAVFSPDGRYLATRSESARLTLWDPATRTRMGVPPHIPVNDGGVPDAFSGDGRLLVAAGTTRNVVQLWDPARPSHVSTIKAPTKWPISVLAVNGDGTLIAVAADGSTDDGPGKYRVHVYDVVRRAWLRPVPAGILTGIVFSPGRRMIAELSAAANHLIDLDTGRPTGFAFSSGELGNGPTSIAFSPDGATVAVGDYAGRLTFWDARTGRKHGPIIRAHSSDTTGIGQILFSPHGDVAASVGEDKVQLWDVTTPHRLGPAVPAVSPIESAGFAEGGAVLRSLDEEGVLREIPVDPARVAAAICARAGGGLSPADWRRYLPGVTYRETCPIHDR